MKQYAGVGVIGTVNGLCWGIVLTIGRDPAPFQDDPLRYPIAAGLLLVGVVIVHAISRLTIAWLSVLPDEDPPTPNPEQVDLSRYTEAERAAITTAFATFTPDVVTTRHEIQTVYEEYSGGYESAEDWWSDLIRPALRDHPNIVPLDDTDRRWGFTPPNQGDHPAASTISTTSNTTSERQ